MKKGITVLSWDEKLSGETTGATHHCRMEGCTGRRVTVKWPDGKITHPCSKGMDALPDGSLKIC